jgi:RNA polymerase sigma factor for flagellar operon FliA
MTETSHELTDALWRQYTRDGDLAVRARLLDAYLGLVHHVARSLSRRNPGWLDYDDLVSSGTLGLVQALESFEPDRGLAFSTYAVPRIRGAILDEIRSLDWVPRSVRERSKRMTTVIEKLRRELGREPEPAEIAGALGVDLETYWRYQDEIRPAVVLPLELPGGDGFGSGSAELADPAGEERDREFEQDRTLGRLLEALRSLPERDRLILTLSYYERLTLKEIGAVLHITESRVSQLRTRALRRLTARFEPEEKAA